MNGAPIDLQIRHAALVAERLERELNEARANLDRLKRIETTS